MFSGSFSERWKDKDRWRWGRRGLFPFVIAGVVCGAGGIAWFPVSGPGDGSSFCTGDSCLI